MKKFVMLLLVLAFVGSFAYADGISFGAWGRGLFVPMFGGTDARAGVFDSWGPGAFRVGATIAGSSKNNGFQADVTYDGSSIGLGDNNKIWAKLFDMVTIQLGRFFDDTLRMSGCGSGTWNFFRLNFESSDDLVFGRVGQSGEASFEIALAPVAGAYAFAAVGNGGLYSSQPLATVLANGEYGAGYTIAGIGTIAAQYQGYSQTINVGFNLTAVPNLSANAGVFYTVGGATVIGLSANYTMDKMTFHLINSDSLGTTTTIFAGVGMDMSLDGGLGLVVDAKIQMAGATFNWGGMVGATIGVANGVVGIGAEFTNANFATNWGTENNPKTNAGDITFAIPIRLEYWF